MQICVPNSQQTEKDIGLVGREDKSGKKTKKKEKESEISGNLAAFPKTKQLKTESFKFWLHLTLCPEGPLQSKTLDLSPNGGGGGGGGAALSRLLILDLDSQQSQQCCFDNFTTFSHLTVVPLPV